MQKSRAKTVARPWRALGGLTGYTTALRPWLAQRVLAVRGNVRAAEAVADSAPAARVGHPDRDLVDPARLAGSVPAEGVGRRVGLDHCPAARPRRQHPELVDRVGVRTTGGGGSEGHRPADTHRRGWHARQAN